MSLFGGLGSLTGGAGASSSASAGGGSGGGNGWEVNLGPLAFGSKGIDVKPQFKVGAQVANFSAEAGVGDIRDGLKVSAKAEAALEVATTGNSINELHDGIRCETPGFREALETAKRLMVAGAAGARTQIAETLGIPEERLVSAMAGKQLGGTPMTLKVKVDAGVGFSAKVCLGWCDTKGYNMVGVGGQAKALVSLGANIFAGRHKSGESAKVILGISNFTFEYTFPLKLPPKPEGSQPVVAEEGAPAAPVSGQVPQEACAPAPVGAAVDSTDLLGLGS